MKMKTVVESSESSEPDDDDNNNNNNNSDYDSDKDVKDVKKRSSKRSRGRSSKRSKRSTRGDFSPDTRKMVSLANNLQRVRISTVDAFPADRDKFTMATLLELSGYKEKLAGLDKDEESDIVSYVSHSLFLFLY
jgi:hypothetical protein